MLVSIVIGVLFRVLGFRVLGFRVLGFRVLGFRVLGARTRAEVIELDQITTDTTD